MKKMGWALVVGSFIGVLAFGVMSLSACGSDGCNTGDQDSCNTDHTTCVTGCETPITNANYQSCIDGCDSALCTCLDDAGCQCNN